MFYPINAQAVRKSIDLKWVLYDGTAGLYEIKQGDRIATVQDPEEAQFPCLPQHALQRFSD
ncbi:hypothetical protein H6G00_11815 [Leptolyngbya sp. FACHB-541]|nr:hypothetical protein [Leptolyngbya sp. FACHB-541]